MTAKSFLFTVCDFHISHKDIFISVAFLFRLLTCVFDVRASMCILARKLTKSKFIFFSYICICTRIYTCASKYRCRRCSLFSFPNLSSYTIRPFKKLHWITSFSVFAFFQHSRSCLIFREQHQIYKKREIDGERAKKSISILLNTHKKHPSLYG